MPGIGAATAYCNNEVAYLAWTIMEKIPGCLGFEVTRVYLNADNTPALRADGTEDRVRTAAFVAFKGQRNPGWNPQDTGVWPVQKLAWRDLTLRKRRDSARRRPDQVRVRYKIRPIGNLEDGMEPVPPNGRKEVRDPKTGKMIPAYEGRPRLLGYRGQAAVTNPIFVSRRRGPFQTTFTKRDPRRAVAPKRPDGRWRHPGRGAHEKAPGPKRQAPQISGRGCTSSPP
jgi:hypothetical protein